MSDEACDWFAVAVDEITAAGHAVRAALDAFDAAMEQARDARSRGASLSATVEELVRVEARELRVAVYAATADWQHLVMRVRSQLIRGLVDEEGLTFADVARIFGVSRQMATRLYQATAEDG